MRPGDPHLRLLPPPELLTRRGIVELEKRIGQFLPLVIHELFEVDTRRYLFSVLDVRVASDRRVVQVRLGLRFLPGSRFCCMEPGCHFLCVWKHPEEIAPRLARRVGLPASVELRIDDVDPLTDGAEFLSPSELERLGDLEAEKRVSERLGRV